MVPRWKFSTLSIFLAILLASSSSLPPVPALDPANATPTCPQLCWSLTAKPTFTALYNGYSAFVPFHNGFNSSVEGTFYFVMRNRLGQTVSIDPTITRVPSGGNATLHPSIGGLFPPGNYSAFVFATNSAGVAISNEMAGFLESTYEVILEGTATSAPASTGPLNVTLTIQNMETIPVVVNVTIIASDPHSNRVVGQNLTEIAIPEMSWIIAPYLLIGTDGLALCTVNVIILMQDLKGANLAPPSGDSQDC